ncbi:hypothetical protein [uncultured Microbacterium sp.]|uniref:hypothetical protein n=1 Tax=uncultured Microbacterium sp. TaxID=191216 RepID=UPI0025D7F682|nr:hypothetical protein [uncultured Microbacterium sp.]
MTDPRGRCALTEPERAELAVLQARVYGAAGRAVDDATVRRLRSLEDRASGRVDPAEEREAGPRASDEQAGPDAAALSQTVASHDQPESRPGADAALPPTTTAPRRRGLRPGLVGAAAVIVVGAFVAGLAVGRATDAGGGGESLPEEGFAQTEEDLSSSILSDGRTWIGLEAASVRFIATIDDASVYLGRREEGELCLAVVYGSERGSGVASVDCGDRDATAQIDGDRWVSVGRADPAKMNNWSPSRLEQSRLSPSVTLHVLAR